MKDTVTSTTRSQRLSKRTISLEPSHTSTKSRKKNVWTLDVKSIWIGPERSVNPISGSQTLRKQLESSFGVENCQHLAYISDCGGMTPQSRRRTTQISVQNEIWLTPVVDWAPGFHSSEFCEFRISFGNRTDWSIQFLSFLGAPINEQYVVLYMRIIMSD